MLEKSLDFNLLRNSPKFLIDQNNFLPFLAIFNDMVLLAVRQEVKRTHNSIAGHELELAIKRDIYGQL